MIDVLLSLSLMVSTTTNPECDPELGCIIITDDSCDKPTGCPITGPKQVETATIQSRVVPSDPLKPILEVGYTVSILGRRTIINAGGQQMTVYDISYRGFLYVVSPGTIGR